MKRTGAALGCNSTNFLATQVFFDGNLRHQMILSLFFGTMSHFFGDFTSWFSPVTDPRQPNKTTYPLESLAFIGILMFVCNLGARRQVRLLLPTAESVRTFQTLFHVDRLPHGDTLNDAFKVVDPEQMQGAVCSSVRSLIRKKVLYPYRVLDKYFVVAVDGTGTVTYSARHCPHCLTQTRNGKTTYYHNVLEAKLVTPDGFAFSLMSEFIENPGEKPKKQDCELKAFYRLAPRLKAAFPRLPILLSLDALYAGGPVFQICKDFDWKYMIILTDDDLRSVNEEFHALAPLQASNRMSWCTGPKREINQSFRWVDDILYTDSEKREHTLQAIECVETKPDTKGVMTQGTWRWITNMRVSRSNVVTLANEGGRDRWKIENQGFKAQKRGGYELEHAYTADPNAAKIFYYLLQIAHMITQLMFKGSLLGSAGRKALGSVRNLARLLLEAWRNRPVGPIDIQAITTRRIQIRFCPDTS
jgi:hypothetical protein